MRVFDPVAGGEALLVIDVDSQVLALAFFVDPATGMLRLAWGGTKGAHHRPGRWCGEALVVIDVGSK